MKSGGHKQVGGSLQIPFNKLAAKTTLSEAFAAQHGSFSRPDIGSVDIVSGVVCFFFMLVNHNLRCNS